MRGGTLRLALVAALSAAVACGGGPSAPRDTIPPATPDASLVSASIPLRGISTVTGSAGAVEAGAAVVATNEVSGATATATASGAGGFSLEIPAGFGDDLSLHARDAAGNESPSISLSAGPDPGIIRIEIAGGNGQIGVRGRPLVDPLVVRASAVDEPLRGLEVRFLDETPDGSSDPLTAVTDADGLARIDYVLGRADGAYRVRAVVVDGGPGHELAFDLEAVGPPEITEVVPDRAAPGEAIVIRGRNFSPIAAHDIVRIGGERANVAEALPTRIHATVPQNLPGGDAPVEVELTGVSSAPASLEVLVLPVAVPPPGEVDFAALSSGRVSITLPFSSGEEAYVLAFGSTAEAASPFDLEVRSTIPISLSRDAGGMAPAARPDGTDPEAEILAMGYEILDRRGPAAPAPRALAPARQTREFWVVNNVESRWERRSARLVHDGRHVAIYVDEEVPEEDVPAADVERLGEVFETEVYGPVREVYGVESDIDGNGRPILLMTPLVNALARDGSRVLGFFMPGDLADAETSNRAEILYLLVPDPEGRFGPPTPEVGQMLDPLAAVAAHEFVHLIVANQRRMLRALSPHVFWLEEGLAHYGELVAGRLIGANLGAYVRGGTRDVSLFGRDVFTRGAATLLLIRIAERFGREAIGRMVIEPLTGVAAVEGATGGSIGGLLRDFAVALHNELYSVPELEPSLASIDLLAFYFSNWGSPEATNALGRLRATVQGATNELSLSTRRGALAYVVVTSEKRLVVGELELRAPADAALQVTTLRVR